MITEKILKQKRILYLKQLLTVIPALLLGILGMISNDVSTIIWLQNLMAMILCGAATFILIPKHIKFNERMIAALSIILLLSTFLMSDIEGVHRWIKLAIINVNIAMVVLPISLIAIYRLLLKGETVYAALIIISAAVILFLQPDASQLAGFSIPVIIFLFNQKVNIIIRYTLSILLISLTILSWLYLDKLEPVSYVEGILSLLTNISFPWLIVGIISLILIQLTYILFSSGKARIMSISIGIYYFIIIISTIFGNFPVPVMGYGISPIIGYWIVTVACINEIE